MKFSIGTVAVSAALSLGQTQAAFPASIAVLMDSSVDPCEDFYAHSCGTWVKNVTLKPDEQYSLSAMVDRNNEIIEKIIRTNKPIVGEYWEACMGLDKLTAQGNKPLQPDFRRIEATKNKVELSQLAGLIGTVGSSLITGPLISNDPFDSSVYALYVGSPNPTLPDWSYYQNDTLAPLETAYRAYISNITKLAGFADHLEPKCIEDIVLDFEMKLAAIQQIDEVMANRGVKYTEAATRWPLTFKAMTDGFDLLQNSSFTINSTVYVDSISFMDGAEKIFLEADFQQLKLYYYFLYAHTYGEFLGEDFVQTRFLLFDKAINGVEQRWQRTVTCSISLREKLPNLIGQYYVEEMFDSARENDVRQMAIAIEKTMGGYLDTLSWLDAPTRKEAKEKLSKVTNFIGGSKDNKTYPFKLKRDDYYYNVETVWVTGFAESLSKKLEKKVSRTEWDISPATTNAKFTRSLNAMMLPAAFLQPPVYTQGVHPAQNFGFLGAVIGHELIHGFDSFGRLLDGDGNNRDWWTPTSAAAYDAREKCLVDQYSSFSVAGEGGKLLGFVNGTITITENIADNGGVSLAFDAYRDWVKATPPSDTHGLTDAEAEKLFFLSNAQYYCIKMRDEAQKQSLTETSNPWSPNQWRVNGVMMNSDYFAKTFQCKPGSKMNPEKKCKLWQP